MRQLKNHQTRIQIGFRQDVGMKEGSKANQTICWNTGGTSVYTVYYWADWRKWEVSELAPKGRCWKPLVKGTAEQEGVTRSEMT